ncbi:MAG: hypothetical protein AAF225_13140 [Pseudomonadota bacterium]
MTGLQFSYAPEWTAGGSVRYTFPSGLFGNARVRYTDESFALITNEPSAVNDSRTTLDLIAGYDAENYRVEIFATNVTDEEYYTFNPADSSLNGAIAIAGDPRVIGGRVLFQY